MFRSRKAASADVPSDCRRRARSVRCRSPGAGSGPETPEPQPVEPAKRAEAAVLAGSYLQDAIEESRARRVAAEEDRRLAAASFAEVQRRCDALLAGAEQIVLERATEVQARSEESVALLQDAQRRADELILAATITVEEAKQAAERHRAEAAEMLARTGHLSDELLAEARIRVEELLGGSTGARPSSCSARAPQQPRSRARWSTSHKRKRSRPTRLPSPRPNSVATGSDNGLARRGYAKWPLPEPPTCRPTRSRSVLSDGSDEHPRGGPGRPGPLRCSQASSASVTSAERGEHSCRAPLEQRDR